MDMNYDDGQDYYEPCSCCGEFGHWAQDCQNKYRMNQNIQCNNQRGGYSNVCQNQIGRQVDQSELDDIRVAIKELTSIVKEVMYRQEILEARHQLLLEQTEQIVTHVRGVVAVIADSGTSSNHNQVDPTHQFSSSQNTDSAHIDTVSFQPSSELYVNEQTPSSRVEKVVERSEYDIDQDLISQTKLETKNVEKSFNVPFPSALIAPVSTKPKVDPTHDEKWEKFEKRNINLPFLKIIKENPDNVECLKELSSRKRRHKIPKELDLTNNVNAVLLGTLPTKLQDPGAPIISIQVGNFKIDRALLDLGASVSILPGSLFDQYDFGSLEKADTTVVLADQTPTSPRGIVRDVIIKVGDFYYPVDFLVLDCVKNYQPTVILGRPFLATAHANINCVEGTVKFRFGSQKMTIKIFSNLTKPKANAKSGPSEEKSQKECFMVNGLDENKRKRQRKRTKKRKRKGSYPSNEEEAYMLFLDKYWGMGADDSDDTMKKACKHPTQPP